MGCLDACVIQALQSYGQATPVSDHKAYTITATYHRGDILELYSVHHEAGWI